MPNSIITSSLSRGSEDSPEKVARFQNEVRYMTERWGELLQHDPYYSPMLNLDREDFGPNFKVPPPKPWLASEAKLPEESSRWRIMIPNSSMVSFHRRMS